MSVTGSSAGVASTAGSRAVRAGTRVLYLVLLAGLTLALLTAAQISTAYLNATGAEEGVSAVAIQEAGLALKGNRQLTLDLIKEVNDRRQEQRASISVRTVAGLYQYAHTVAFRRVVIGCYPDATVGAGGENELPDMSWNTSVSMYKASKAANENEEINCANDVDANNIIRQYKKVLDLNVDKGVVRPIEDQTNFGTVFEDCANAIVPRSRLDCHWDNLTRAVGLAEVAERYQNGLRNALDASASGLDGLATDRSKTPGLSSPEGASAVAAYQALVNEPSDAVAVANDSPTGVTARISAAIAGLCEMLSQLISRFVAALVVLPVLAQSALMAMAAGALGGGIANLWEGLGYGAGNRSPLDRLVDDMEQIKADLTRLGPASAGSQSVMMRLNQTLLQARTANALTPDRSSLVTATFLGSVAALLIWLLTTGGLFVLSGGENTSAASPNVLLAIALISGLARAQVIDLSFTIATRAFTIPNAAPSPPPFSGGGAGPLPPPPPPPPPPSPAANSSAPTSPQPPTGPSATDSLGAAGEPEALSTPNADIPQAGATNPGQSG